MRGSPIALVYAALATASAAATFGGDPRDLENLFDASAASAVGREWSGGHRQCRGSATELNRDEATVAKSHHAYGREPYPADYFCRWLFLPQACDLGVECSVDTQSNLRRGRSFNKCHGGDYVRLVGYRGTSDNFYCGSGAGFNVSFAGSDAVALIFRTRPREESDGDGGRLAGLFDGFNCKIVCRKPGAVRATPLDHEVTSTTEGDDGMLTTTSPSTTTKKALEKVDVYPGATFGDPGVFRPYPTKTEKEAEEEKAGKELNCHCGESRRGRIVCPPGMNCTVTNGAIPWQAALVHRGQNNPWCGGTLISDRYVLTAAHCLRGKDALRKVEVVLADHDWTTKKEARDMRYRIVRAISHPKFDKVTKFDYDFALLKLDRSVDFTARRDVRPACLPQTATAVEMVGWRGTASGWGVVNPAKPNHQSRALRAVDVTVEPLDHCVDSYRPIGVTHNMFCAATPDGDACFGDSGGPFTVRRDGAYILEGVISWGRNCAKKRWPGVYARVRAALDWIKANSADSGFCPIDNEGRTIGIVKVEQEKDNDNKEDGHDSDGGWRFEERKLQE